MLPGVALLQRDDPQNCKARRYRIALPVNHCIIVTWKNYMLSTTQQVEGPSSYDDTLELVMSAGLPPAYFPDTSMRTYLDVYGRYEKSVWGMHQATQVPRFCANYGYGDFVQQSYGVEHEMVADLGDRIHPVLHNWAAHNDFIGIVMSEVQARMRDNQSPSLVMSPFEVAATRFALMLHDAGESTHEDLARICGRV